ncbi:hypothetical protein GUK30_14185 [Rhizobium leguminosarum]|uniref:hypothetical protein n=1 Tax=Rhizobium ruizarguesonis TaxID=2081791 RepID=UPI0013C0BD20|nr:hypothetical protein [Rhizobium ruizarguesonis]NEI20559.1 hypothetical protein [Rhizobium ruizarguesonis]
MKTPTSSRIENPRVTGSIPVLGTIAIHDVRCIFYIRIIDARGHPMEKTCRISHVSPLAILLLKNNSLSAIFDS